MRSILCLLMFVVPLLAAPVWAEKPRAVLAATPLSRMDLPWWRERHEAKLGELRRVRPDLIFLGDSITQNWELRGPPDWANFEPVWQHFYGGRNAVNLGFTGDATAHLLWRIENGETAGIAPKVAVVLIGANNMGKLHWPEEDTLAGFDAIVRALRQRLPATKILLLGVLPSDRSPWVTTTTTAINRALAGRYRADTAVTFLDVGHVLLRDGHLNRDLFYDPKLERPSPPLHPSAEGQRLIAKAIEPTLAALLGDKARQ